MHNRTEMIGHMGADPEVKYTESGKAVVNFGVATSESWKDADGEKHEHTEWFRCVAWGTLAEVIGEHGRKGSQVFAAGRARTREWEDKDGETRHTTEIVIDTFRLLGKRPGGSEDRPSGNKPGGSKKPSGNKPGGSKPNGSKPSGGKPGGGKPGKPQSRQHGGDDDIPF